MASASHLLNLQAPGGALASSRLRRVTDPIAAGVTPSARMRHFFEGVYDLSPGSHLSRFMEVLLGDAGVGYLSKVYAFAHSRSTLATMRYGDLDAFYGDVLGLKRMGWEHTDPDRYYRANTPSEWDEIEAKDAAYRARIEAFSRAIGLGPTPSGLKGIATALLGTEVRLYESYLVIDSGGEPDGGQSESYRPRLYTEVETELGPHRVLDRMTYADIEGRHGTIGRAAVNDRAHFLIRPMRPLSSEEAYRLKVVIDRFKPVGTLFTVDHRGLAVNTKVTIRNALADSVHWRVDGLVHPKPDIRRLYVYGDDDNGQPILEQPVPAETNTQTEEWDYNGDVANVKAYREIDKSLWDRLPDPEDNLLRITGIPEFDLLEGYVPGLGVNYQRMVDGHNQIWEYPPIGALGTYLWRMRNRPRGGGTPFSASPVFMEGAYSRIYDQIVAIAIGGSPITGKSNVGKRVEYV